VHESGGRPFYQYFNLSFNNFKLEKLKLDVFIFDFKLRMYTIFKSSIFKDISKLGPTTGTLTLYLRTQYNNVHKFVFFYHQLKKKRIKEIIET
jgi:hypothetical protein